MPGGRDDVGRNEEPAAKCTGRLITKRLAGTQALGIGKSLGGQCRGAVAVVGHAAGFEQRHDAVRILDIGRRRQVPHLDPVVDAIDDLLLSLQRFGQVGAGAFAQTVTQCGRRSAKRCVEPGLASLQLTADLVDRRFIGAASSVHGVPLRWTGAAGTEALARPTNRPARSNELVSTVRRKAGPVILCI